MLYPAIPQLLSLRAGCLLSPPPYAVILIYSTPELSASYFLSTALYSAVPHPRAGCFSAPPTPCAVIFRFHSRASHIVTLYSANPSYPTLKLAPPQASSWGIIVNHSPTVPHKSLLHLSFFLWCYTWLFDIPDLAASQPSLCDVILGCSLVVSLHSWLQLGLSLVLCSAVFQAPQPRSGHISVFPVQHYTQPFLQAAPWS